MYNRLLDYVNANNILYPNHFGFREKHSTYMALLKLIDDILEEIDNKNFSIGVFIDLSKALDTINHYILIKKLNSYGIRGVALEWLKNYLTNRLLYVSINYTNSSFFQLPVVSLKAPCWAPSVYPICQHINLVKFILFADDTNLFFKHKDLETLINIINTEIVKQYHRLK